MSKTKTPFLSLGSQGSLANTLTSQKRGNTTILRTKPYPTDRRTLPQMYQRWLYEDYVYLWSKQSTATRAEYAVFGAPLRLSGFQYWMKYHLLNLPDIGAWWRMDNIVGNTAYDLSKNGNDGTVFGAIPATGQIDKCLDFDGSDDRIVVPTSATIQPTTAVTVECFIYPHSYGQNIRGKIFSKEEIGPPEAFHMYCGAAPRFLWYLYEVGQAPHATISDVDSMPLNTWTHVMGTYDGTTQLCYANGVLQADTKTWSALLSTNTRPLYIGIRRDLLRDWDGLIDNFIIYNRALDATEALRHSGRRYPPS